MGSKQADRNDPGENHGAGQQVGDAVRRLRAARRLSVRTLASKSGFSASFISQVELGHASPSIASLERIAAALGVTLGECFQAATASGPWIVKSADRHVLRSDWSRAKIETLAPISAGSRLEAILVTLKPGGASGSRPHAHEHELLAVVFEGAILLTLEEAIHPLERGDAVTIPAGTRHRWQNKKAKPAVILKVAARVAP